MRSNVRLPIGDNFDARVWMAAIMLSVGGMGVWAAVVSYNNTMLTNRQVTMILREAPPEVRTRAVQNLRDDSAIQTLGQPVTRGRLRNAIDAADTAVRQAK
ncbi:hypothetical protein QLH51_12605 [Sphingomonas sp. 2R-10]|uniref:hypothetical protein n=1 Tax=Sphingomonas sp. 2R-10 TaxID=3045148 RepID=UPI0024B97486|nr:hypothetical protein [Sphingomonas sp. 2R-10]MDJ0277637.1 hypothetical protein [Sphingomonas sp. 2R-10]